MNKSTFNDNNNKSKDFDKNNYSNINYNNYQLNSKEESYNITNILVTNNKNNSNNGNYDNILTTDECYFSKNENNKFCTFDDDRIDNTLEKTDISNFIIEIRGITQYLKQFNNLVKTIFNNNKVICMSVKEYGYSREKILIYNEMCNRLIILINYNVLKQHNLDSKDEEIYTKEFDYNNDSIENFLYALHKLCDKDINKISECIYNNILKDKILDLDDEENIDNLNTLKEMLKYENKIREKYKEINFKSSLTNLISCIKYMSIIIDSNYNLYRTFFLDVENKLDTITNTEKDINVTNHSIINTEYKLDILRNNNFYKEKALDMYAHYHSFKHILIFLIQAFMVEEFDLFNQSVKSDSWQKINNNSQVISLYSQKSMRLKIKRIFDMLILGSAFVSKGNEIEEGLLRTLGTGYFMSYFFFSKKRAEKQAKIFNTSPKLSVAKQVWSLLDNKGISLALKLTLPSIKFSEFYLFKKTAECISFKYLEALRLKMDFSINENKSNYNCLKFKINLNDKNISKLSGRDLLIKESDPHDSEKYVKVKIIHNNYIQTEYDIENSNNIFKSFLSCFAGNHHEKKNYTRNSLIIHIHGGGFVAMSASSHETYLRKWSKKLEIPIISIDYRLAPENPYPDALDDVYQAYCFIIKYAENILLLDINKIILVGDSAGGCLSMGLCNLLIIKGLRLPDALFLMYPCLRLDVDFFSPSKLISLKDQILSITFLLLCKEAYFGNNMISTDDYFSNVINTPNYVS